jgi:hypothetical protein
MATRALMAIKINELLALRSELTRVMFSMVVAGRRNLMFFFSAKKAVDEHWEVVRWLQLYLFSLFSLLCQNVVCRFCSAWQSFGYCLFIPRLKKMKKR